MRKRTGCPPSPPALTLKLAGVQEGAAGVDEVFELAEHLGVDFLCDGVDVLDGFQGVAVDELGAGYEAQGDHVGDAVGDFEDLGAVGAALEDAGEERGLGFIRLAGDFEDELVDLGALVVDRQEEVVVEVGDVLNEVVDDGGLEEDGVDVAVVEEDRHGVDLVAEHVAPALAGLADEGSRELHVGGNVHALEAEHLLGVHAATPFPARPGRGGVFRCGGHARRVSLPRRRRARPGRSCGNSRWRVCPVPAACTSLPSRHRA